VYGAKPTASGKRISTVGALGLGGLKTALCFEGTLTGAVFLQFLDEFLVPMLEPGQIVSWITPRPIRWQVCVNGLKARVRGCFICPRIRLI
jgi:hypothetical protein